ncbi:MAG: DNA polymerase III subunit gamma/tau [Candidatus Nanosynbacter sp.]|nr:DNA polymerase III subunit gamma/tau [Candidatus Nanosynbacter sp.]
MSQALYRKYRSKSLSEIVGQDHVTSLLDRALESNKVAHAYLLTGPRGTGKTSVARILAHKITGLPYDIEDNNLDIIEIDAASNNGVDNVRDLREKALVAPIKSQKKVYIIDEVHMLSKSAFNALLKIIEEPPEHVVFILATTDFDKVPDTIVSRTQRYNFRLIDESTVADHLAFIAKEESIKIDTDALNLIAERGGGSLRDSISLLDQIQHSESKNGEITRSDVEASLGLATKDEINAIGEAILSGDALKIITAVRQPELRGIGAVSVADQLYNWIQRNLESYPYLVTYFEDLIKVQKSHRPDIAILVAVLKFAVKMPEPQIIQHPSTQESNKPNSLSMPSKITEEPIATAKTTKILDTESKQDDDSSDIASQKDVQQKDQNKKNNFNWQSVLDYLNDHKSEFKGIHTILEKSKPIVKDNKVSLYVLNKFNKTELDKRRAVLGKILSESGVGDFEIEIIDRPAPPQNEQAAKVAAIMGGGEEVDV